MNSFVLKAKGPFSLRLTALSHGFCQVPPFEWDSEKNTLDMAVKIGRGKPIVINISQAPGGVTISGPNRVISDESAEALGRKVAYCLRLNEDYSGFYKICEKEPGLKEAANLGAGRMLRSPSVFEDIIKSICGTNVAWKQAVRMIHAIASLGDAVDGTDRKIFPEPETIFKAGPEWLREHARVGYRADYIIDACKRVMEGELDLKKVERGEMKGEELRNFFLSVKGIGKSTAHYLLMLHGEYFWLSIDSATHGFMKKMTGRKMTDKQIEKRYSKYGEWKALVLWYEWLNHSGWVEKMDGGAMG